MFVILYFGVIIVGGYFLYRFLDRKYWKSSSYYKAMSSPPQKAVTPEGECRYCLSKVPAAAQKCSSCGEWLIDPRYLPKSEAAEASRGVQWSLFGLGLLILGIFWSWLSRS